MTYQTNNPVGSVDVRDLYDNAEAFDNFSAGPLDAYPDRLGVPRQSLQGIRNASQYVALGPYAAGLNFTSRNQVFSYDAGSGAEFYAPGPAITLPYTTTGVGASEIANFRSVGDAILRADLANDTDPAKGAALVGFTQGATGGVGLTVEDVLKETVCASRFGLSPSNTPVQNTIALNNAVDYSTSHRKVLKIPTGVYLLEPSEDVYATWSGYTFNAKCAVVMKSHLHIEGEDGCVLKIRDNFTSPTGYIYHNMFMSNTDDLDISFKNIIFDMNGQNNLIADPSATGTFGIAHTAAIMWSTNPSTLQGRVQGLKVEDCTIRNVPGTNAIVLAFYASLDYYDKSRYVSILNNKFENNGFNTSDFTQIYCYADDVIVEGNTFISPVKQAVTGTAIEIHGNRTHFRNNLVIGEEAGVAVCVSRDLISESVHVTNNHMVINSLGIYLWGEFGKGGLLKDVFVLNNYIKMVGVNTFNDLVQGIALTTSEKMVDVLVDGNIIDFDANGTNNGHVGIALNSFTPGDFVADRITLSNNQLNGQFFHGIYVASTSVANRIGSISICGNRVNSTKSGAGEGIQAAVTAPGLISAVYMTGNQVAQNGAATAYAFYGDIHDLYFDGSNVAYGGGNVVMSTVSNRVHGVKPVATPTSVVTDIPVNYTQTWGTQVITDINNLKTALINSGLLR